jgi:hypothetical protein
MSGGIAQLVAVGAQDVHLVGQPEVSFFRSNYKRHTNFSQTVERQVIQGNVSNNGMSTIRFERKGDMLNYVYLVPNTGTATTAIADWTTMVSKIELLVGGQVIDEQDSTYSTLIAPVLSATSTSKSVAGDLYGGATDERFYPLRFAFCENWQTALPLIALQYHDVELRITWGSAAADNAKKWDVYANYAFLDTQERELFASQPMNLLITQVQKAISSGSKIQELNFNHPVKYLASADSAALAILNNDNKLKLQINGTDVADFKFADPNFSHVPLYYHTTNASKPAVAKTLFFYPFCLDAAKLQPTGTLNFSRLDSARIICDNQNVAKAVYAVNYNVLRIENGMGGLLYSN